MNLNEAIGRLNDAERDLLAYSHAMGVLSVDGDTVAPKNSAEGRAQTMSVLSGFYHEIITDPALREACGIILAAPEVDRVTRRRAEERKEESDDFFITPKDEYMAYEALVQEAGAVWHEAKGKSDWEAFRPYLEKIVDFNRRYAARKDASKAAYDVLLDNYEKGCSMAALDPFFADLREKLTPLIAAVGQKPQPDTSFITGRFPVEKQRIFSDKLMALMGINRDDCAIGETEHPFTDSNNKHDVRITTHYHEEDPILSMYSVIHEGGHALYELGVGDELQGTCLEGGSSTGIHESQSRFYENIIGRSLPFCEALLPLMRDCFLQMRDVTAEQLWRAVNKAQPSLIRTEADELTYSMHVMIRYELEKAMMSGELAVKDVPGEWNRMYKTYLGIDVPDHRRGVLQDSHWSFGGIGYFPGYALGNAYGAQMLRAMERDIDVWGPVGRGDLSQVTAWLREHVHRHGRLLLPAEILRSAVGGPFDPSCYTDYLTKKYSEIYGL